MRKYIEPILDNGYKVLIYNGQNDVILPAALTQNYIRSLNWIYKTEYNSSKRIIWKCKPNDPNVAGYVHHYANLTQVLIRDAGHMVPADQPQRGYDLIRRFIFNESFKY